MKFLTNEKLTLIGAAGMIGSNMAQTAAIMRLTSNICLYDPFEQGLKGVIEEMRHCSFEGINFSFTTDIAEALQDAKYIISAGGAPRKEGMTREDLLRGNSQIAAQLGKDIKCYAPEVKHVVIIFNPADITGLVTLIHSGLKPNQVTTLAALDSNRLQSELAKHFGISQSVVTNCRTYGGHGESMAVFASTAKVNGTALSQLIGTEKLSQEEWQNIKTRVMQGGANIIKLRNRSSFQSPAYVAVEMIAGAMGGEPFTKPSGCYVNMKEYPKLMMAMETRLDADGVHCLPTIGTAEEMQALSQSAQHLQKMVDQIVSMGIIPVAEEWNKLNPNL